MCKSKCLRRDREQTDVELPAQLWVAVHALEAAEEGGDAG